MLNVYDLILPTSIYQPVCQEKKDFCEPHCNDTHDCYFIPSPVNELHITNKNHYKYDASSNKLAKFDNDTSIFRSHHGFCKFVYDKSRQRLMKFEPYCRSNSLYVCHVENDKVSNWKIFETLPTTLQAHMDFDVVLAWDQVIFLFEFR